DSINLPIIYLGMYNGTVLVYDSINLTLITAISLGNVVRSISASEKFLITGDDSGTVSIFDTNHFKIISKKIHSDFIRKVLIKDNLIYSCSDDCSILISDLNLGRIGILEGHKHFVMDFFISNTLLYSVSLDCSLGIFNLQSKKGNFITLHDNGINCVTLFDKLIVTGSDDPSIKLVNNSVVISKVPFASNVVKIVSYEETLMVCCENGEFTILSKELEVLHKENLRTKLWDVKIKNNKMFLGTDEGLKVYDFIKLQFGFVSKEKAFFVEGDSLFYTRFSDNAFLVKDTKLQYEPEKVIFSENGKSMCIFKENNFNLINTLGFRTKLSGECKDMSLSNDLFVTLSEDGLTLYENNKLIDNLKIFPKKVKLIDNFLLCQFDNKIQLVDKEGNLIKELETNENLSKNKTEEIIKIKDKEITKMKYEIELLKEKEEKLIEEKKEKYIINIFNTFNTVT
ncbi:WD40 domain-containing protein, partial [Tubulinosema ratisbonensis]